MPGKKKLPQRWEGSTKAARAVQIAFDLDQQLQGRIRRAACLKDVSPSYLIRSILDLPLSPPPKRPRLTVSLSPDDYEILAGRYGVAATETWLIRRLVMEQLIVFARDQEGERT